MTPNNLKFVRTVVNTIRGAGLDIWLFGGWAEELRGLRAPGGHSDIDLLLRAANFGELEAHLGAVPNISEIPEKRFSHKRAFVWNGVRVEVFLARPGTPDTTTMFDGRVVVRWPADTFASEPGNELPVVSNAALALYRHDHRQVERAYRAYREASASAG